MNFDAGFVTRLKLRDAETCAFLVSIFSPVLEARLRYRFRNLGDIEDIRNETFCRVLRLVDGGCVRQPEQFGSLVRGVCDRVAQEFRRKNRITEPLQGPGLEPSDCQPHADDLLVENERKDLVWRVVMQLPEGDRQLIVAMYRLEQDRCQVARDLGISPSSVNVRLCRALKRLRARIIPAPKPAAAPVRRRRRRRPLPMPPGRGKGNVTKRWATMAA
jgi:RNA polymerase sigma-70 factor (ECF subfamily)